MSEITTKEKILNIALDMFSKRGYDSVSIRDIGKSVGIKESSIYYHFKNKQEIFDELIKRADQLIIMMKSSFDKALSILTRVDEKSFILAGITYVDKFLLDKDIYKIINMLLIEKQTNQIAESYYYKMLFETPLNHHKQVFQVLIEKNIITNENVVLLASEYQSIILFVFFKYFTSHKVSIESKIAARKELTDLLTSFYCRYFRME